MEIRLATTEDKGDVLALNDNIYDGRDYLPAYYDFFLQCPVAIPFVITLDEEVLGYLCGFVIDGGETLAYRDIFMYKVLPAQLGRCSELLNSVPDRNISIHGVAAYLDTEVIRKYLFPEDRMIVDWVPCRLLYSNLDLIDAKNIVCATDVKVDDGTTSGLLSIGTFYKVCRPRYLYKLDLYGTDINSVHYHLVFYLGFIAKTLDDLVSLLVFANKQFEEEKLLDSIVEYRMVNRTDSETTFQILFESIL